MADDKRRELMDKFADSLSSLRDMDGMVINVRTLSDGANVIEVFDIRSGYSRIVPLAVANKQKLSGKH